MNNLDKKGIIVFAKYPENGKVKTRLSATIGENFAKNFYKICAEHTFEEILKVNDKNKEQFLFYSDKKNKNKISEWTENKFLCFPQRGKDLGEKMLNAFKTIKKENATKAIIVGTDLPDISSDILNKSFELLNDSDIVIGPATDGGYYLLGMKKIYKELFSNMPWSSDILFDKTLNVIKELGLEASILPELSDIDTEEDLWNWIKNGTKLKPKRIKSFVENSLLKN